MNGGHGDIKYFFWHNLGFKKKGFVVVIPFLLARLLTPSVPIRFDFRPFIYVSRISVSSPGLSETWCQMIAVLLSSASSWVTARGPFPRPCPLQRCHTYQPPRSVTIWNGSVCAWSKPTSISSFPLFFPSFFVVFFLPSPCVRGRVSLYVSVLSVVIVIINVRTCVCVCVSGGAARMWSRPLQHGSNAGQHHFRSKEDDDVTGPAPCSGLCSEGPAGTHGLNGSHDLPSTG